MCLRHSVLALLFLLPQPAFTAENFGRVELSLNQWQETMDRVTRAEAAKILPPSNEVVAPCDAVISSVKCEITPFKNQIRLTTDFEIEILNEGWILLPLADASLPLVSSQVSEGRIVMRDHGYVLMTNKPGKIKVRLIQEQSQFAETQNFWLAPSSSLQARVTIAEPNLHFTLNDVALDTEPVPIASDGTGKTSLRLQRSTEVAEQKTELIPGVWQSRSETQISYEDGRLIYWNRVVLLCTSGNDQQATLILPPDCIVLQAQGEELEKWIGSNDGTQTNLQLNWKKLGLRQRVVFLQLAITQPNIVGSWLLIAPQTPNQAIQNDIWQITTPPGLQQATPDDQPLAASLSEWMRTQLTKSEFPVFQASPGSKIEVGILKTITLAEARIESAKFSSELAVGGGMLTDARLEILASEKTMMDLQFSKDARIISCRVAGQKQNPIDLGEGKIRLNIPVSDGERSVVELTFSQQLSAFDPASGQVRLTMPLSSLLTKNGTWSIRLPAGLSLSAFDGSVIADSAGPNGELRFHQELYRDSSPLVVLFYQKKIK